MIHLGNVSGQFLNCATAYFHILGHLRGGRSLLLGCTRNLGGHFNDAVDRRENIRQGFALLACLLAGLFGHLLGLAHVHYCAGRATLELGHNPLDIDG